MKQRTRVKLRLRAILSEHRIKPPTGPNAWTQAWLRWPGTLELDETSAFLRDEYLSELGHLNSKICVVEHRLLRQTSNDAVVAKLLSIEGIGPIAAIVCAEIARFDSGKQLSRYCGVTPEWHLVDDNSSCHRSFERMSRIGEDVVPFLAAFQMTGLITIGPVANSMCRDGVEDLYVDVLPELGVVPTAESNHWLKRFKSLNRSFEAELAG